MHTVHDPVGLAGDPGVGARIKALQATLETTEGVVLIRNEIMRGTIRVIPARDGGLTIVPARAATEVFPGGSARPIHPSRP